MKNACLLIIFAKAPIAGKVKTRLIPTYGAEGAKTIHEQLVERVTSQAVQLHDDSISIGLHIALNNSELHPFFDQLQKRYDLSIQNQVAGDLGAKMHAAIQAGLKSYAKVVIVGTDWAAFDVAAASQAINKLNEHDYVFIPACDGGYVLIGASHDSKAAFTDVDWGTEKVMQQTETQLKNAHLNYCLLPASWDVDHPEDVERARAEKLI